MGVITFGVVLSLSNETGAATSVNLGKADSFAVLAGTTITNVPTSNIKWDVGLSPAAGSNYAGLTSSQVGGTIFAVDTSGPAGSVNNAGLLTAAKADLAGAYDALSSGGNVPCDTDYAGTQDLVGMSLDPGVYCAEAFELSGTLTLSGSGVWIFRSESTLITSGEANIVGGDPCNVWWKVPSSATLGANTSFKGNILALTSIAMNSGASLNGRALARNGAVTLDNNVINNELCAVAAATGGDDSLLDSVTMLPSTGTNPRGDGFYWIIGILATIIALPLSLIVSQKNRA